MRSHSVKAATLCRRDGPVNSVLTEVNAVSRRELEAMITTLVTDSANFSVLGVLVVALLSVSSPHDKLLIRAIAEVGHRIELLDDVRLVDYLIFLELLPGLWTKLLLAHRPIQQSGVDCCVAVSKLYRV